MLHHICGGIYCVCLGGAHTTSYMWRSEGDLPSTIWVPGMDPMVHVGPYDQAHITRLAYTHSCKHSGSSIYATKQNL